MTPATPPHVLGMHVQAPAVHTKFSFPVPLGHAHWFEEPQPSLTAPQAEPTPGFAGHAVGAQQVPALQVSPAPHPQLFVPPQPSSTEPQAVPMPGFAGHACGVQHAAGVVDVLQVSGAVHPQRIVPPQPSSNEPHSGPPVSGPPGTFAHV